MLLRVGVALLLVVTLWGARPFRASAPDAPPSVELAIASHTPLSADLADLVLFGGLKESYCDASGNIYSRTDRKYGSAIDGVVRFTHAGSSYVKFSIDKLPELSDGTITDFEVEPGGDIYALARQVLKYTPTTVPIEFGHNFIVHFDANGKASAQIRLQIDTSEFNPTGFALLKNGGYLVVGARRADHTTQMAAQLFHQDGSFASKLELDHAGTKSSNGDSLQSTRVVDPAAIHSSGFIYVMRGYTIEPVFVLSEDGKLVKTIQLSPPGIEFDSPKISGDDLMIHAHTPPPEPIGFAGGIPIRPRADVNYPVFSLNSGAITVRYHWKNESFGVACYQPGHLTFIGQDAAFGPWEIFEAGPAATSNQHHVASGL
ncbi:MAG: hypothetical protein ABSC71_13730 [Candidatus Acidiferrales bacterium]